MLTSKPLRKKGGIIIKKLKFFLMIIFSSFFINNLNVYAETASFYEGEYIDNIYMNKYQYSTKTTFYQKARFFRKVGTNEFAYCIEPFSFFSDNKSYESTVNPYNLSKSQLDHISKIAYFGYGYKNHTANKWYAITQMMIWQASDPSGDYYFTDTLNGNRVNYYLDEIEEINRLIDNYNRLPSFADKNYTIVEGHELIIQDHNHVLPNFKTNDNNIVLSDHELRFENPQEGEYIFNLYREENNYNKPLIFYQSKESQNLIKTGDLNKINTSLKVNVLKTFLTIIKVDKDSMTVTPSGDAILDGAIYTLYDNNMNEISDFEVQNNQILTGNLDFGKYYLKEKEAGIGYTLDLNTYEINIDPENTNIELIVTNEVIKKKVILEKQFGNKNIFKSEKDIDFEIYNKKGDLIKTISTNELGIAEIILPYGEYTFIQKNTTKGYQKVEPFKLNINDSKDELINLKDYKIPVPDTSTNCIKNFLILIFQLLLICLC